ncbi:huntingtin-interacting protein K-like [Littorina saxatilis]|uniref:Nascent polypeptide-associated complex subunit alpha-like UBA domain-containing protein n=1 Tax=Littorina saxatilis TaxID=31220 RepID=A0AAN9B1L5_9CAEN
MAAEEEPVDLEETENDQGSKAKKSAKHDSGAADLEKVTDYVEEAEISSKNLDDAMKVVSDQQTRETKAKQEKEKELSKVKINKDDVDLIIQEMEIPRMKAERVLREHKGNVVDALTELVN